MQVAGDAPVQPVRPFASNARSDPVVTSPEPLDDAKTRPPATTGSEPEVLPSDAVHFWLRVPTFAAVIVVSGAFQPDRDASKPTVVQSHAAARTTSAPTIARRPA